MKSKLRLAFVFSLAAFSIADQAWACDCDNLGIRHAEGESERQRFERTRAAYIKQSEIFVRGRLVEALLNNQTRMPDEYLSRPGPVVLAAHIRYKFEIDKVIKGDIPNNGNIFIYAQTSGSDCDHGEYLLPYVDTRAHAPGGPGNVELNLGSASYNGQSYFTAGMCSYYNYTPESIKWGELGRLQKILNSEMERRKKQSTD